MPKTKTLSRGVAMVGAGMSKFGAFPEKGSRDLFVEAFQSMRQSLDKDFDPADIETIYVGNFSSDLFEAQSHTAPIMADVIGLASRPASRIEDACASSGVALRQGILAIASGLYDVALVGGIEIDNPDTVTVHAAAAGTIYEIRRFIPGLLPTIASHTS
jgi:acetyl-CoA C-acetyltransferase